MNKKALLLFLTIGFPVVIFLFLKGFGDNQYLIPVLYEQGLGDSLSTPCLDKKKEQYVVNNELVPQGMKIIHFERMDGPVLKTRLEELERVQDVFFNDESVTLNTFVNSASIAVKDIQDYDKRIQFLDGFWKRSELDSTSWANFKYCAMAMTDLDNRVVLVDKQNRIRGYYNILERDETDRLILELRILKTKE